jgi:hypothetical protein
MGGIPAKENKQMAITAAEVKLAGSSRAAEVKLGGGSIRAAKKLSGGHTAAGGSGIHVAAIA